MSALEDGLERDLQLGSTQQGPHRADLKLSYDERQARKLVSRGQQKLLASAMILAATETAQTALERPLLLLLDDPAAELDAIACAADAAVVGLGCQVIATSLEPKGACHPRRRAKCSTWNTASSGARLKSSRKSLKISFEGTLQALFDTMRRLYSEDTE